jgi:UDP-glucose 4-epimerase
MTTTRPATDRAGRSIRRAAVIGAAGFIGSKLSAALTSAHVDTACFTRRSGFLSRDELSYPLHRARIVFYLASSVNPSLGEQHPDWAAADHRLFADLLGKLAAMDTPPTVVLTSSGGTVYDQDFPPPYSERSPVRASGRYGAAKLALERELWAYAGRVPGVILRLSNAYGPGQATGKGQGVLAYWMRAALDGLPLRIIGDPECTRDYVYIDDIVDCMRRVDLAEREGWLRERADPLTLNIGSGVPTSLTQLVRVMERVVGRELAVERLPGRHLDRRHVWLRVDSAREVLGWRPLTGLEEGVARMWRSVVAANSVPAAALSAPAPARAALATPGTR